MHFKEDNKMEELKQWKDKYLSLSLPKRCLIIFGSTLFGITAPLGTVLLLVELWNVLDKKEKK